MGFLSFFKKTKRDKGNYQRSLAALISSRMAGSWSMASADPNGLAWTSQKVRQMVRTLEETNPYVIQFLRDYESNVIGNTGIKFQSKVVTPRGKANKLAREAIEDSYHEWKEQPTVQSAEEYTGPDYSDAMRMVARTYARDGAVFVRLIRGWQNEWSFAIQLIEADLIAENLNQYTPDSSGNRIIAGKEIDAFDRPVAYHFYRSHPDILGGDKTIFRIAASEIIDYYVTTRIGRTTGLSLLRGAIKPLKQLSDYEDAELIAAKAGACAVASIEKDVGSAEDEIDSVLSDGSRAFTMEPGAIFDGMPAGWKFKMHKAEHPNTAAPEFRKMILRGAAAAIGCSYNALAQDLESTSYSSLREGKLKESDMWKMAQMTFIRTVERPIFNAWLKQSLLVGAIKGYNITQYDELTDACWHGRRWDWVDPQKDAEATMIQLGGKLTTMAKVLAEKDGSDLDDVLAELEDEKARFNAAGFKHPAELEEDKVANAAGGMPGGQQEPQVPATPTTPTIVKKTA